MVTRVEWQEKYSVGSKVIDSHHKKLIHILNELEEAVEDHTADKDFLAHIAKDLAEYTDYHFNKEEEYMQEYKYPELQAHREEHGDFIKEVKRVQEFVGKGDPAVGVRLTSSLRAWFIHHILIIDKEYAVYFQKNNIHLD